MWVELLYMSNVIGYYVKMCTIVINICVYIYSSHDCVSLKDAVQIVRVYILLIVNLVDKCLIAVLLILLLCY